MREGAFPHCAYQGNPARRPFDENKYSPPSGEHYLLHFVNRSPAIGKPLLIISVFYLRKSCRVFGKREIIANALVYNMFLKSNLQ